VAGHVLGHGRAADDDLLQDPLDGVEGVAVRLDQAFEALASVLLCRL
jgi:hypothetical protein